MSTVKEDLAPIVVVADRGSTGHHPETLILTAREAARLGYRVWVLGPFAIEAGERIRKEMPEIAERMKFAPYEYTAPTTSNVAGFRSREKALHSWKALGKAVRDAEAAFGDTASIVFLPFLDDFVWPLVGQGEVKKLMPRRWTGLYMLPTQYRKPNKRHRFGVGLMRSDYLLRGVPAVALVDEGVIGDFEKSTGSKGVAYADAQNTEDLDRNFEISRRIREVKGDRTVVVLAGSLEGRKGLFDFLKASRIMADDPFLFVAAGGLHRPSHTDEELKLIDSIIEAKPENLILSLDRVPDEGAFNSLIDASDVVWIAYPDWPFSSGLMTKAAHFRRHMIVCEGFLLGERAKRHNLGEVVQPGDVEDAVRGLRALRGRTIDEAKFAQFASLHSLEHLRTSLAEVLKTCLADENPKLVLAR